MAERVSPTLLVLREIRDEIKETNERLDRVEKRVGAVEEKVGAVENRVASVENRQVQAEIRLATEIVALAKVVGEARDLLHDNLRLREQLDDHEKRIGALEAHHT